MNYFKESIKSGLNEYDLLRKSLNSLTDEELSWKPNPHSNLGILILLVILMLSEI